MRVFLRLQLPLQLLAWRHRKHVISEPRETVLQAAGQGGSQKQGLPPPTCKCGEPATERVSWTTKNPERKFYKCSQPEVSLALVYWHNLQQK